MGIRDDRNGTLTIDYRDNAGKRHRETITGSKTLAKEVLNKRLAEIAESKYFPERQQAAKLTLAMAIEKYWDIHLSKKKSAFKLRYTLNALKKYFGDVLLSKLTTEDIQRFYNTRMAETSPSTANRNFTTLRAVINKVIRLRLYKGINPCIGVAKQKENPARTSYLSTEQIRTLLGNMPERSRNLVAFAICTGMRRGEILRVSWQDIDLLNGIIHIYESKSGNKREVPIMSSLKQILLTMNPQKSGVLFPFTETMVEYDYKRALKKSNITGIRFHDLRHTFASHFMMNGGSLTDLQRILGHSDLKLTQRYAHLSPTYLRKSIEVINNLIPQEI